MIISLKGIRLTDEKQATQNKDTIVISLTKSCELCDWSNDLNFRLQEEPNACQFTKEQVCDYCIQGGERGQNHIKTKSLFSHELVHLYVWPSSKNELQ